MIPVRMTVFVFVLCECQRGNTEKTKNRQLRFHKLFLNYFQFQFHLFCVWMSSHHSAFPACNPISAVPRIKREAVNCVVSFWILCRKRIIEISGDSICAKSNIRSKLNWTNGGEWEICTWETATGRRCLQGYGIKNRTGQKGATKCQIWILISYQNWS